MRERKDAKASPCPYDKHCGGCQYLHLSYRSQLEKKQRQVRDLLGRRCRIQPIIGMENPWHYRHKVQTVFGLDRTGTPVSGIYEEKSHRIVPVKSCLIEEEQADAILATIRSLLKPFKIKVYDEDSGYGLLRYVLIRKGYVTGEILVVLVTASPVFPSKRHFVDALRKAHPEITTVVQNVNSRSDNLILGEKNQILYGRGYITDEICGRQFKISPTSFYQVNPQQAEKLYKKALELADLSGRETVVDAYCGTGTIGILAAGRARQVYGVENNPAAVRDAVGNARANGVSNIRFFRDDAGHFLESCAADRVSVDVVFLDPPRAGSSQVFLESVARIAPRRVVYVSCNPETLARDAAFLETKGYRAKEVWPVDMFPWTASIETVCLLSKLNVEHHIEVELNLDEMDLTAAEKKASYEEIKTYVQEHSGLKVSNLYIAQVKRKCGIIERENYNKAKAENARQPKCPEEKERAIREALEYFKMV